MASRCASKNRGKLAKSFLGCSVFASLLEKNTHRFLVCSPSCTVSALILYSHSREIFGPLCSSSLKHRNAEGKGPLEVIQSNFSLSLSLNNICTRNLGASIFFTEWQHLMKNLGYLQLHDHSNLIPVPLPRLLCLPGAMVGCQAFLFSPSVLLSLPTDLSNFLSVWKT